MIRLGGILRNRAFHLCFIYHPKDGMSIAGGFLARFNYATLSFRKLPLIHNTQFVVDLSPVTEYSCTMKS